MTPDSLLTANSRTALITGAASGLGAATARRLAAGGARLALLDRDRQALADLADELGVAATPIDVDVTEPESVERAMAAAVDVLGEIRICVNAAGVATPGRVTNGVRPLPLERFRQVVDINLVGMLDVIRHCATAMCGNTADEGERGVIVNVASGAWHQGQRGQAAYAASKAGVVGLTLPLARDLAEFGIRVVTVAPGLFDTSMAAGFSDALRAELEQMVLFPSRLGDPAEFASLVEHIAANRYLNATVLDLDAGIRMV